MEYKELLAEEDDIVLYTIKDIQRIFHMGRTKASALIHSNGFPVVQINRRYFVEKKALEKWLKQQEGKRFLMSKTLPEYGF